MRKFASSDADGDDDRTVFLDKGPTGGKPLRVHALEGVRLDVAAVILDAHITAQAEYLEELSEEAEVTFAGPVDGMGEVLFVCREYRSVD